MRIVMRIGSQSAAVSKSVMSCSMLACLSLTFSMAFLIIGVNLL